MSQEGKGRAIAVPWTHRVHRHKHTVATFTWAPHLSLPRRLHFSLTNLGLAVETRSPQQRIDKSFLGPALIMALLTTGDDDLQGVQRELGSNRRGILFIFNPLCVLIEVMRDATKAGEQRLGNSRQVWVLLLCEAMEKKTQGSGSF